MTSKSTVKNNRRLKITSKFFQKRNNKGQYRSELRLTGRWLEEFGFQRGQFVTISCENKRLIITGQ